MLSVVETLEQGERRALRKEEEGGNGVRVEGEVRDGSERCRDFPRVGWRPGWLEEIWGWWRRREEVESLELGKTFVLGAQQSFKKGQRGC